MQQSRNKIHTSLHANKTIGVYYPPVKRCCFFSACQQQPHYEIASGHYRFANESDILIEKLSRNYRVQFYVKTDKGLQARELLTPEAYGEHAIRVSFDVNKECGIRVLEILMANNKKMNNSGSSGKVMLYLPSPSQSENRIAKIFTPSMTIRTALDLCDDDLRTGMTSLRYKAARGAHPTAPPKNMAVATAMPIPDTYRATAIIP